MNSYRYIFGPAPSRRFGRSLGVDLTPMKTCTFDCVFCQLGRTPRQTVLRRAFAPVAAVEAELRDWRAGGGEADVVTLAGSGEPTLHRDFGAALSAAARATALPTVLLTNGSLLYRPAVRRAAARADIVKVSLSAWDEASFRRVNRPHPALSFKKHVAGLRAFRAACRGALWLEVFLVPGLNDAPEAVERIARIAETITPDRIHLNTAARPPAEPWVRAASQGNLEALATRFHPTAIVIGEYARTALPETGVGETRVLDLLRRRPCTLRQIAAAFARHPSEISKYLGHLAREGQIGERRIAGETFFRAKPPRERKSAGMSARRGPPLRDPRRLGPAPRDRRLSVDALKQPSKRRII